MKARSRNAIGWFTLCTLLASLTAYKIIHDDIKISSEFNDTTPLASYPNGGLVWNETWGTEYDDVCEDVWLDPTSTYAYTCGWTVNTSGPFNDDACLVKWHASNGTVAWNRTWGGPADDLAHGIWGNETHVFTVGRTESYGAQGTDISIIAWDAITGAIEWNVTWSSSSIDIGYAITGDANSNLYACGQTQGMLSDIIVLKFDSSGNEMWNYTLALAGSDVAHAIWVDDAGSFIFCCGETDSIGAGSTDMILVRVQSTGSLFNYNTWGYSSDDKAYGIYCNLGIGRLFTVGYTNNHPIPSWNSAIVEWDATCNALSNTTYDIPTNDVIRDVWFSSDEIITAGWALNTSTSDKELLVLKWDLSSMQVKRDFMLHGTDNNGFKVAFANNDSHLFIQMRTYTSTIGSFGYPDMMLLKWNIDGFPVVANFSANDTDIFEHGWVEFNFTGSEGDDPVNFQWNFGDVPGNSTAREPVHQYMNPGTYTVTLTVTDADGETDTMVKSMLISVQILLPIADFEANETTITEGDAVLFTYNGTPGNGIASIDWDFGDGNVTTGGTSISHVYESNGSYDVYINASDIDGDWTDKYKPACITVQNLAPVADFYVDNESITEESTVIFTYNGTIANGITSYTWDFGDGNVTTGTSIISHQYNDEGSYSVNVTVVDLDGDVSSLLRPGYISVVNVVPVASFTANNTLLLSGSSVEFTFTGDLGLGVETFQWDYGDGITQNLTSGLFGGNPVHVYANPGNFTVNLTTWDADNESSSYELPVQIVVLDGSLDPDGDGLSNELELSYGTDPFDRDSDGDGYLDGAEVDAGSDPMNDSSIPSENKIPGIMVSLLFSSVLIVIVFLGRKCRYQFQY